jgi:uncharacterized protein YndB with AHSA1/START domain
MVRRTATLVFAAVLGLLAVGLALPRRFRVERRVHLEAQPARIRPALTNPRTLEAWTRDPTLDPQALHSFGGPEEGVGARWAWRGPVLGSGAMTVAAVEAGSVTLSQAIESEEVNATTTFTLSPEAGGTWVQWKTEGLLPPLGGCFVGTVEARLGQRAETALKRLKRLIEAPPMPLQAPRAPATTSQPG